MTIIRCTVRLQRNSGVEANASVNVHHIWTPTTLDADRANRIRATMTAFYESCAPYLGRHINRGDLVHSIELATVTTGAVGVADDVVTPIQFMYMFYLTAVPAVGAMNLPSECAIVLSHAGSIGSVPEEGPGNTRPKSRRRGRFYLGPLSTSCMANESDLGAATIAQTCREAIGNAFQLMVANMNALILGQAGVNYGVYSPTSDSFWSTTVGHIDNQFDTMRSRGEVASARTIRNVSQVLNMDGGAQPDLG